MTTDTLQTAKDLYDGVRELHRRIKSLEDQLKRKQRRAEHWRNVAAHLNRQIKNAKAGK